MTVSRFNVPITNETVTTYRAWGLGFSNAFKAVGLIQTANTGQVNWATVSLPTTGVITRDYEIFRFNDALQATRPVFIRISYGTSNVGDRPFLSVRAGTATDGAGNLTGLISNEFPVYINLAPLPFESPQLVFGDTSSVAFSGSTSSTGQPYASIFACVIERSRSELGIPNGDGLWLSVGTTSVSPVAQTQILSFTLNSFTPVVSGHPFAVPTKLSSFLMGTALAVFPAIIATPKVQGPGLALLACGFSDFPRLTEQQITIGGTLRNYIAISGVTSVSQDFAAQRANGLLLRWE